MGRLRADFTPSRSRGGVGGEIEALSQGQAAMGQCSGGRQTGDGGTGGGNIKKRGHLKS